MSNSLSEQNDLHAIEMINRQDVQFAVANDSARMMSQWTDDFVLLQPAGPILRGRSTIAEAHKGIESSVEILEGELDMLEIKVLGDYAFEWGTYRYSVRPRTGGDPVQTSGKLMRILQRQPDGSWKMHRTICTVDPPTPSSSAQVPGNAVGNPARDQRNLT
jgi:ketosteroid isomerase-like protein